MDTIVVSSVIANKYLNGGNVWAVLSWVLGLQKLGFQVYFVEQIDPAGCVDATGAATSFADSVNRVYFRQTMTQFGLAEVSALIDTGGEQTEGLSRPELLDLAESADLLVNISGHLALEPLKSRFRRKAYIDFDPGFTQFWHAAGYDARLQGHDSYFTLGENIGTPDCPIPTSGISWQPIRQPIVWEAWFGTEGTEGTEGDKGTRGQEGRGNSENSRNPGLRTQDSGLRTQDSGLRTPPVCRFTTVATWRGPYGPVYVGDQTYGLKVHQFRRVIELPELVQQRFEIALDIHPAEEKDLLALQAHGWHIVNPRSVVPDAHSFRQYIRGSDAEFSVAQGVYVETNSGWFSDRTVRYLASGKPALVQDTGFSRNIPVGEGLAPFRTLGQAVAGAREIARDYNRHSEAALSLARKYFDSDRVLGRFIDQAGLDRN